MALNKEGVACTPGLNVACTPDLNQAFNQICTPGLNQACTPGLNQACAPVLNKEPVCKPGLNKDGSMPWANREAWPDPQDRHAVSYDEVHLLLTHALPPRGKHGLIQEVRLVLNAHPRYAWPEQGGMLANDQREGEARRQTC